MAAKKYTVVKQTSTYYTEYVIDNDADIAELPVQPQCSTGSVATVLNTGNVFKLNHKKQWVQQYGSGGGGLSPEDKEQIINEAMNRTINKVEDGAPIEYDTFKEVADYISQDKVDTQYAKDKVDSITDYTDSEIDSLFNKS